MNNGLIPPQGQYQMLLGLDMSHQPEHAELSRSLRGGGHDYNLSGVLRFTDWVVTLMQKGPPCLGPLQVPSHRGNGISLHFEILELPALLQPMNTKTLSVVLRPWSFCP